MSDVRLQRASDRAVRLYPKSEAFQGVYVAGATAALKGKPASVCPYRQDARGTWRRSYRIAWLRGHKSLWEGDDDL